MNSLRLRLLLAMMAIVLVVVASIVLLSSGSTTRAFQRYVGTSMLRDQRTMNVLLQSYQEPKQVQERVAELAQTYGERILVRGTDGIIIADSQGAMVGQYVPMPMPPDGSAGIAGVAGAQSYSVALPISGTNIFTDQVGSSIPMTMNFAYSTESSAPAPPFSVIIAPQADVLMGGAEVGFLQSANGGLVLGVMIAMLAAVLLTWLLSRRILGPVEQLTVVARRMEAGDLSQRVLARGNDEIGKLAHAFNAMADGLVRQEGLRRNMVGDIAHELRTPLTNIQGYLEALSDGVVKPDASAIALLHEEATTLSRMVDDLQQLSLADAGKLVLHCTPTDLAPLLNRVAAPLRLQAETKGIALQLALPKYLPLVTIDSERIAQVLYNLLTNALAHTSSGTITITASDCGDEVEVAVTDTGSGIPAAHLPHLFERFYRADPSRTRATGGSGLGLAIVKQLIELHGGRVAVESAPDYGSTFSFILPVSKDPS